MKGLTFLTDLQFCNFISAAFLEELTIKCAKVLLKVCFRHLSGGKLDIHKQNFIVMLFCKLCLCNNH